MVIEMSFDNVQLGDQNKNVLPEKRSPPITYFPKTESIKRFAKYRTSFEKRANCTHAPREEKKFISCGNEPRILQIRTLSSEQLDFDCDVFCKVSGFRVSGDKKLMDTLKLDEMTVEYNRLQERYEALRAEFAVMERVIEKKNLELQKVIEFALRTKKAEYESLFMYNRKLFDQISDSIKTEFTRFKEFPEITEKLGEIYEAANDGATRFINEKKRVITCFLKNAQEMRRTQTVIEMPVANVVEAPDVCSFYRYVIEMLMSILNGEENKETKLSEKPVTEVNVTSTLSSSIAENPPDSAALQQSSGFKTSVPSSSISGNTEYSKSVEPSRLLKQTEKNVENSAAVSSVAGVKPKLSIEQKLVAKLCVIFPEMDENEIVNYKNEVHRNVSFHGKRITQIVEEIKSYILSEKKGATNNPTREVNDKESCSSKTTKRESRIVNVADAEKQCTICLEMGVPTKPMTKLGCGHSFHGDCLKDWVDKNHSCPNCRAFALSYDEYPKLQQQF